MRIKNCQHNVLHTS